MSLMMLVFWGGLAALVVWIVRSGHAHSHAPADRDERTDRAMDVLEERFARGEIDQAEFERRRSVLRGG